MLCASSAKAHHIKSKSTRHPGDPRHRDSSGRPDLRTAVRCDFPRRKRSSRLPSAGRQAHPAVHGQSRLNRQPPDHALRNSDAINAAWSPNGQRIAFARDYAARTYAEHLDIAVINADGTGLHAFGLHGLNGEPSWSPDGRHVVWWTSGGFAIANSDGSGLRKFRVAGFDGTPVFSPDGKRIAFRRSEHQGESICIVNANGSGLKRVKTFAGGLGDKIDWSPDGSRIAYDTPSFGDTPSSRPSNVFTMRTDGTGVRQLTHGIRGQNYGLDSWSPDGKKIAFVWNVHVSGTYAIYMMNADGTHALPVTPASSGHLAAWGTHP